MGASARESASQGDFQRDGGRLGLVEGKNQNLQTIRGMWNPEGHVFFSPDRFRVVRFYVTSDPVADCFDSCDILA